MSGKVGPYLSQAVTCDLTDEVTPHFETRYRLNIMVL